MSNKTLRFAMLCVGVSFSGIAQQQPTDSTKVEQLDEIVITDSKFNLKREHSGKIITKITQEQLENSQGRSIVDIINSVSGIEINGAKSTAGQNLSYFVRGGRNRQVLILIDGIALSDPSQIANDYDLRLLNTDQIESIEILKGAASTLYGSGAATAVINITLKKASKSAVSGNFTTIFGSNQDQNTDDYRLEDFRNSVSLNGTLENFNYLASFGNQYTDGLSAVAGGTESDPYNAINGNLKLGYSVSKDFQVNTYASFDQFKADYDDGFTFLDADNISKTKQYRFGIAPKFSYLQGSVVINAAYNNIERKVESGYPTKFEANSFVVDAYNKYELPHQIYTVLGVNFQQNEMQSFTIPFGEMSFMQGIDPKDAYFNIIDPYVNVVYASEIGVNINAGLRMNNHSEYGSHFVYSLNPSYTFKTDFGYLKGLASFSTAFITPSLYQLFEPSYGNKELKPEENRTIEVGSELKLNNNARVSVVYFNRKESNFIDFIDAGNFEYQYKNIEQEFTASGIEIETLLSLVEKLDLQLNGTYTQVDDQLNLRIPEFKANATLQYQCNSASFMSLSYQYNDDRSDSVFNNATFENETIILKSYGILDFYVSQKFINNKLKVFANLTNILNEDYQELFGYSTRGRNINLGLSLSL